MAEQIKVTPVEPKMPPPSAPVSQQLSLEDIQREIALRQLRQLDRKEAEDAAADAKILQEEENRRAQQLSMMATHRKREADIKRGQDGCPHEKENKKTAVVGLRDSRNHYIFNCQNCMKMWNQDDCPPHLRPAMEAVGGPQY